MVTENVGAVSRERLTQIAARKLAALGIAVHLGADGQTLEGQLTFSVGGVTHPIHGTSITGARFQVVPHDKFLFRDPPLAALPPLVFFDLQEAKGIEDRIGVALRVRLGFLRDLGNRMQTVGLTPRVDPDALILKSVVKSVSHNFEIVGTPEGVRVSQFVGRDGKTTVVSTDYPALKLEEHDSLIDLEIFLSDRIGEMTAAAVAPAAGGSAAAPAAHGAAAPKAKPVALRSLPPPQGMLPAALLSRFGAEAAVGIGAGRIEVTQELEVDGERYKFIATHEAGATFRGRLSGPAGDRWSDRFDLARFPGVHELATLVLEIRAPEAAAPEAEGQPAGVGPQQLAPQPGEIWVMNVLVERDDAQEIRYTCVDVNGRPYGAARVLPRADFERAFARQSMGWRLRIQIEQIQGQAVVYRQLDAQGQPGREPRSLRLDSLMASFVPEASDY